MRVPAVLLHDFTVHGRCRGARVARTRLRCASRRQARVGDFAPKQGANALDASWQRLQWAMLRAKALLPVALAFGVACDGSPDGDEAASVSQPPASAASASASAVSSATKPTPRRLKLVLVAGGDVELGRMRGQLLLREPERNDFAPLAELFGAADVRFVNLECPISDQKGQTESPHNKLVFTAPPAAAAALARGGIDIVSLANNHAWDYGKVGLFETFDHLQRERVAWVGAGKSKEQAYAPVLVERDDFTVAFLAVTDVWNQELSPHPGKEYVADADAHVLAESVRKARALPGVDRVVVSHHGGYEYVDQPHDVTRALARAAIAAGADAFIGHHSHVVQRVAFVDGKPVFYGLGNLLMRMASGKPWTELGALARITWRKSENRSDADAGVAGATRHGDVAICPVRIHGLDPVPLAKDPDRRRIEGHFRAQLERLLRAGSIVEPATAATLGEFGADGCASLEPAAVPR